MGVIGLVKGTQTAFLPPTPIIVHATSAPNGKGAPQYSPPQHNPIPPVTGFVLAERTFDSLTCALPVCSPGLQPGPSH